MINIKHPSLLIDAQKCTNNILRMKNKADKNNLNFRPHFKTHQSGIVGELFKKQDIEAITVSSLQMAMHFIYSGWKNITIAIPFNIRETQIINKISQEIKINLLTDSVECTEYLARHLNRNTGLFVEIDSGYHRTGLAFDDETISNIIGITDSGNHLNFKGFLAHAGNTYNAEDRTEILQIFNDNKRKLQQLKRKYKVYKPMISYGDTPSCTIAENFEGIDEIRPGNFVYYDLMQYKLGSCTFDDIAVAVACPVISKNSERRELVLYGGAVHLSKDNLINSDGNKTYGNIVPLTNKSWGEAFKDSYVSGLSQEHGIISASKELFEKTKIGDLLGVIPVHSCLTADLMKESQVVI